MVSLNFDATNVRPNVALEPVPSNNYRVMITKTEEKPTKAGDGSYLEVEMTIQDGEFRGRKVFDRLNLHNKNQQAVEIAQSTLSAICWVTGRVRIQDSSQLHGVPFMAVVMKVPRDDRPGQYSNEVRGYKDINGNDPGQGGAGNQTQAGGAPNYAQGGQPQQGGYAPQNNGGFQGQAPQNTGFQGQPQQGGGFQGQPQQQGQSPQGQPQQGGYGASQDGGVPPWQGQQGQQGGAPQNNGAPQGGPPAGDVPPWQQQG